MRTKNLRRKTERGGTATLTGPQPARVKDRIDVDHTFGDLVMRRAKAAKVGLTEEQKEQAILFAIHLFHARATSDPIVARINDWSLFPTALDPKNNLLVDGCHSKMLEQEFIPRFRVKSVGDDWRNCTLVGVQSKRHDALSIPFEALFGKPVARGIARYMLTFLDRPEHQLPAFYGGGSKPEWQSFASQK